MNLAEKLGLIKKILLKIYIQFLANLCRRTSWDALIYSMGDE